MWNDAGSTNQFLADYYGQQNGDPDLADLLRRSSPQNDAELAELIEQDGRQRIDRGLAVTLERYIGAVPDLAERSDPLDAALDVTLRSMSRSGRVDHASVAAMIERYPGLEIPIREAAALTNALWSTTRLQEEVGYTAPRALPQDFGPPIDSGTARYELRRFLGSGAFGQVYLAEDRQLSEDDHSALVAIKIFSKRVRTQWSRQRLLEEATKARRVDHPNVVRVLDRGVSSQDEDFIVYEVVDGGDLAEWLRAQPGPVPIEKAARMVAAIARGVQAAHAAGLVHCDLKPGNIMLSADRTPKVADFGVAIRAGEHSAPTTSPSNDQHPIGNLAYISPEQYRMDDGALNVPSDIYALGGILFTMLTGRLPNGKTLEEIAKNHDPVQGRKEPPALRPLRPEVDRDLEAICRRAMAIQPEDRYSSAGAFADDIDAWLRREPLYWTSPPAWHVAKLWCRRKPGSAVLTAMLGLCIVAGTIITFHLTRAAAIADAQREIEAVRAEEEARRAAVIGKKIVDAIASLNKFNEANRATIDIFPATWAIESMMDRGLLDSNAAREKLQDIRLNAIRRMIAEAEAQGRENDLETAMWKTTLALWLAARRSPEAETVLTSLEQHWRARLEPNDSYLRHLEAIRACIVVNRYLIQVQSEELSTAEATASEELIAAQDTLRTWEEYCRLRRFAPVIHELVLERLMNVYSPLLLNDPTALDQYQQRADELRARRVLNQEKIRSK